MVLHSGPRAQEHEPRNGHARLLTGLDQSRSRCRPSQRVPNRPQTWRPIAYLLSRPSCHLKSLLDLRQNNGFSQNPLPTVSSTSARLEDDEAKDLAAFLRASLVARAADLEMCVRSMTGKGRSGQRGMDGGPPLRQDGGESALLRVLTSVVSPTASRDSLIGLLALSSMASDAKQPQHRLPPPLCISSARPFSFPFSFYNYTHTSTSYCRRVWAAPITIMPDITTLFSSASCSRARGKFLPFAP